MGIPRLWPLLSSCRRLQTLEDLSMDSFSSGTGYRALRLGIGECLPLFNEFLKN
jgi:hypothetical protein